MWLGSLADIVLASYEVMCSSLGRELAEFCCFLCIFEICQIDAYILVYPVD